MKIIVTGAAGFIGMHTCIALLKKGYEVVGVDNINDYYDINLKLSRIEKIKEYPKFKFERKDITIKEEIDSIFERFKPEKVVHLAAQAGVRYSLVNPEIYIKTNINGFFNVLENCRKNSIKHFLYASSSSVYGGNKKVPFCESDKVDNPVSLYAATKKSNELMAYTYSHLFGMQTTGLRFFTVYGPWGRPDMSPMIFTRSILAGQEIDVFNHGNMKRDFTYIDDIVDGIIKIIEKEVGRQNMEGEIGYAEEIDGLATSQIYNIGNSKSVGLLEYIKILEDELGVKAKKRYLPMQSGDVFETYADISKIKKASGFEPNTRLVDGIKKFIEWYRCYYK